MSDRSYGMNRKTMPSLDILDPTSRRRMLKRLGVLLAAPAVPPALRYALQDLLIGKAHAAAMAEPTLFVEINYRDQIDFGQVVVAPGLATNPSLKRGETGEACALNFGQNDLLKSPNGMYFTPQSRDLMAHADSIAWIDLTTLTPGGIHYHQSANYNRVPGSNMGPKPGLSPVYTIDKTTKFPGGNEAYHANIPTPASFHNYVQKTHSMGGDTLRNGVAFKCITRSIHTVYHFGNGLQGAELDRIKSRPDLLNAFGGATIASGPRPQILPSAAEADFLVGILKRVDPRFLKTRSLDPKASDGYLGEIAAARRLLHSPMTASPMAMTVGLDITPEEKIFWQTGVPEQGVDGRVAGAKADGGGKLPPFQIWEQYAFAYKLLASGLTRSVALECEFPDLHGSRPMKNMDIITAQLALPLSRLITKLKEAGLYDRTVIAVYTTDGSRPPAAGPSGDQGKNTVVLAGGMIRGGYFGDIRVGADKGNGHQYVYHAPDVMTGMPGTGSMTNQGRLDSAHTWRTVMKALRIPDEHVMQFAPMSAAQPLSWALRV